MNLKNRIKNFLTPDKFRFILVGFMNTGIDFGVLFILKSIGMNLIAANFISTGIAFLFSFLANKNYTFKNKNRASSLMIIKFIFVTLISSWGIQTIVIKATDSFLIDFLGNEFFANFISKCLAVGIGLIWNYTLYSHFVFPPRSSEKKDKPEPQNQGKPKPEKH